MLGKLCPVCVGTNSKLRNYLGKLVSSITSPASSAMLHWEIVLRFAFFPWAVILHCKLYGVVESHHLVSHIGVPFVVAIFNNTNVNVHHFT